MQKIIKQKLRIFAISNQCFDETEMKTKQCRENKRHEDEFPKRGKKMRSSVRSSPRSSNNFENNL